MDVGQYVLIVYALLILAGGLMGARAGSKASVIAGTTSGAVLLLALVVSWFHLAAGLWIGAAVSLLLSVTFGSRLAKTGKFMPSGMLLAVSVVALLVLLFSALGAARS